MKILLVTPNIPEYRFSVYSLLSEKADLTVLHNGPEYVRERLPFKQIIVPIKRMGPLRYFSSGIDRICRDYDVIISEANLRYIDRNLMIVNPFRKYKWISWGIGVSASYNKKFDEDSRLDFIRYFIFKKADAHIFYSEYPVRKYIEKGFKPESLFVAHNTTHVSYNEFIDYKKDRIIFVGTLYPQKRIFDLLDEYRKALVENQSLFPLHIIGGGEEFRAVDNWIKNKKLQHKMFLHGPIYDNGILEKHFRSAYVCISPGQAGLSVLTSMGYGTPYITMWNAITGGEIFNIENNKNGILYKSKEDLKAIILDININQGKYIEMGLRARKYYLEHRQVSGMVKGMTDAIDYVLRSGV